MWTRPLVTKNSSKSQNPRYRYDILSWLKFLFSICIGFGFFFVSLSRCTILVTDVPLGPDPPALTIAVTLLPSNRLSWVHFFFPPLPPFSPPASRYCLLIPLCLSHPHQFSIRPPTPTPSLRQPPSLRFPHPSLLRSRTLSSRSRQSCCYVPPPSPRLRFPPSNPQRRSITLCPFCVFSAIGPHLTSLAIIDLVPLSSPIAFGSSLAFLPSSWFRSLDDRLLIAENKKTTII